MLWRGIAHDWRFLRWRCWRGLGLVLQRWGVACRARAARLDRRMGGG